MLQPIDSEQTFVTSLEKFMSKAEKFIKLYYSGSSADQDLSAILTEVAKLASDATDKQLKADYQLHCDCQNLMADHYDSSWF